MYTGNDGSAGDLSLRSEWVIVEGKSIRPSSRTGNSTWQQQRAAADGSSRGQQQRAAASAEGKPKWQVQKASAEGRVIALQGISKWQH